MTSSLNMPRFDAPYLAWNTVGSYDTHEGAQGAVNKLAEEGFPVEHLDIVGSDLRLVERVVGRMTRGRAIRAGAMSGAWTGFMIGLLLSLFTVGAGFAGIVATGVLIGAMTGAAFAFATQRSNGGQRGFASVRSFVAARYDLVARDGFAEQARSALVSGPVFTA